MMLSLCTLDQVHRISYEPLKRTISQQFLNLTVGTLPKPRNAHFQLFLAHSRAYIISLKACMYAGSLEQRRSIMKTAVFTVRSGNLVCTYLLAEWLKREQEGPRVGEEFSRLPVCLGVGSYWLKY